MNAYHLLRHSSAKKTTLMGVMMVLGSRKWKTLPRRNLISKADEPFDGTPTLMDPYMPSQEETLLAPERNGALGRMPMLKPIPRPFFEKREAQKDTKSSQFHENDAGSGDAKEIDGQVGTSGYISGYWC